MPFFVTNKSAGPSSDPTPLTYVDILYDHAGYLRTNNGMLGSGSLSGKNIGIVGAGAAGLCAAWLLMMMGAKVTIFEAGTRAGGRISSVNPIPGNPATFELGAMRVPPSEQLFQYFAGLFGVQPGGQFPDPGKVFTQIVFENQTFNWQADQPPPSQFQNVSTGWGNLANSFAGITADLADSSSFSNAQTAWQKLIFNATPPGPEQGYSAISFFQGLVEAFVENFQQYGLSQPWSAEDFALFGALGVGSGGFGPLYQVNFAEIIRLVVNGLETNQQFYPGGLGALITGFLESRPGGGSNLGDYVAYQTTIQSVQPVSGGLVQVTFAGGNPAPRLYDAVIIATTTRSMQVDLGLTDPAAGTLVLNADQNTAIREIHLMNSSKLFVLTQSKFWLPPPGQQATLPANIQTDGLVRGLYCLDYGSNTNYGVVLISYTWGDDSTKCIAIKDPQTRLNILLNSLQAAVPDFVDALIHQIMPQYTTMIDWQEELNYYGAFKLNYPGQDPLNQNLYYQFLQSNNGIYLAGDSVGWCGGWIEGAFQTGMNAAAAVVKQFGGNLFANNPMTQNANLYQYGP
jgi:tryptophan 2-monooxygenase